MQLLLVLRLQQLQRAFCSLARLKAPSPWTLSSVCPPLALAFNPIHLGTNPTPGSTRSQLHDILSRTIFLNMTHKDFLQLSEDTRGEHPEEDKCTYLLSQVQLLPRNL